MESQIYRDQMFTIRPNIQQRSTLNYFNVLLTIPSLFLADDIVSVLYNTVFPFIQNPSSAGYPMGREKMYT